MTAEPPPARTLRLFEGYGIEIEYMIVDARSLAVLPVSDEILKSVLGEYGSDYEDGDIAWSNELVLHVLEFKTNGPVASLGGLAERFRANVRRVDGILAPLGGRLMPTAMHPWMDPHSETRLWPHENSTVYATFDRIFDCKGHGWSNLQSVHINLPFHGDEEFGRLHAAIRLVLPLLPALAASSPVVEGRTNGTLDNRMAFYRRNARRVPFVSGRVVPEPVFTRADYEEQILRRIYRDVAPQDAEGVLQHEWLNARGAIARFDRMAIEIRVIDVQECPQADLATAALVGETVRALVQERHASLAAQQRWPVDPLADLMERVVESGERTVIEDPAYLELFGFPGGAPATAQALWKHLAATLLPASEPACAEWQGALGTILEEGPLARRILRALGPEPDRERLRRVYERLCDCLRDGVLFRPDSVD